MAERSPPQGGVDHALRRLVSRLRQWSGPLAPVIVILRVGINSKTYNSVINEAPLSARTNRAIGGRAPSDYLSRLANSAKTEASALDKHVSTHLCEPDLLRTDDFDGFYARRKRARLDRIGTAMGKEIDESATDYGDTLESDDDTDDL